MVQTIYNVLRTKEIRKRLIYMMLAAVLIRFGSQVPLPGVNREYLSSLLEGMGFLDNGFLNAFTGGSFENMSVFALSVTPYITASIIIQLLTVAIPKLEELSEDGEAGRKKLTEATRYTAVGLAVLESVSLIIGFGNQGLLVKMDVWNTAAAITTLVAGTVFLMWLGEQISENGIGNGVSFILLVNIVSRMPKDLSALYEQFMKGTKPAVMLLRGGVIACILTAIVLFVIILNGAVRPVPVTHSRHAQRIGSGMGGFKSKIPLKVNTSGVIAVIFASSIMSFPGIIASFAGKRNAGGTAGKILAALSQSNWFDLTHPSYTAGYVLYALLVIAFAYFYTDITVNPRLMAENLKKQNAVIPGTRSGRETERFLREVLRYLVFIGAIGLLFVATFPIVLGGIFHTNVSFGGTSLIIVAGVCIEIAEQIDAMLKVRNYKSFLSS